jgi:hypothetical protein
MQAAMGKKVKKKREIAFPFFLLANCTFNYTYAGCSGKKG